MTEQRKRTVELTDDQVDTIVAALRYDYRTTKEAFGALPMGVEMCDDIESAYRAIRDQTKEVPDAT